MLSRKVQTSLLFAVIATLYVGCGSSSHSGNLTAAQAQAISQQVLHAVVQSLSSVAGSNQPFAEQSTARLSTALADLHPEQSSSGCTPTPNGQSCNFPLSANDPCSGGGSISVAGDVQGTLNNSGAGSLTAQLTITPKSCSLSSVTFSGDPGITIAGNVNFTNTGPTFPVSLTEGGGISYSPNPSGTCSLNVTYTINSLSSCAVTGTVCGQSVSGTC